MFEEEHEYEDDHEHGIPCRRFQKADLVILGFGLISGIAGAISNTAETAQNLVMMHANFNQQQQNFHQQAAIEIERLTSGDVDG